MKKVVIAAFALFTFSAISASAQTTAPAQTEPATQTTPPAQTEQAPAAAPAAAEDKTAVKIEELPEAVKATLASPTLKDWTATEAFLVKNAEGKEYYAINVKKDNESGSIQLDKDGKPVK